VPPAQPMVRDEAMLARIAAIDAAPNSTSVAADGESRRRLVPNLPQVE